MQITIHNRGPEEARLHVLPQLWFRNIWSWRPDFNKPQLSVIDPNTIAAEHYNLGRYHWYIDGQPELLFCENDTNPRRLFGMADAKGYFKDAFHEYLIQNNHAAVNPDRTRHQIRRAFRRSPCPPAARPPSARACRSSPHSPAFADFDSIDAPPPRRSRRVLRRNCNRSATDNDACSVQRQAFAGLIWTQQFYHYDVSRWLRGDELQPPPPPRAPRRPQSIVASLEVPRNHVDARQLGIPLVRRLGFGIPLRGAGLDRRRIRQTATGALGPRMVHAPQRRVARLRMGIRRRQSAGARLGRLASLSNRSHPPRPSRRSQIPGARVPQAAVEFHLVGQSQRRAKPQRVRRRLPGPG